MIATSPARHRGALIIMLLAPLFFSSNLIFGRGVIDEVAPFTLAFLRWGAVALILAPMIWLERDAARAVIRAAGTQIVILAVLGMVLCGGVVYLALQTTSATNGTLIYTTSSVLIIVLEAVFRGRRTSWREMTGAAVAFAGVAVIVLRGDPLAFLTLEFSVGDLLFVGAALAWATYSILYRQPALQSMSNMALLGLIAAVGALLIAPIALWEWASGQTMPTTPLAWSGIAGIVFFSSLLAFLSFQFGVRELGAPLTGIFMYLLPVYGVLMAILLLGERLAAYHAAGIALVMGGIVLATLPVEAMRRLIRPPSGSSK